MRKNAVWALVVIAAALFETTLLGYVNLQGVVPDLTLLLVVYFAIVEGEERAMFTGVLGGVFQDVVCNASLGHHILGLVVVGYAVGRVSTRLVTEHPAIKVGLVFGASLLNGIVYTAVAYVQQPDIQALRRVAASVIPEAFYTAAVTPIVFILLAVALHRRAGSQGDFS